MSDLSAAIRDAVDGFADRVVGVGPGWGLGSGFVLEPGFVVTSAHNVPDDDPVVRLAGRGPSASRVMGRDLEHDLAVIAAETDDVAAATWADPSPRIGDVVVALARPGGRDLRVTAGHVSGTDRSFRGPRGRRISGSIEHTAPMARGSSGGPLLDASGRVAGINTHRLGDGFYLAIPAGPRLRRHVDALVRGEVPSVLRLGVALTPDRAARRLRAAVGLPEREGVLVRDVDPDGPAGQAGVRRGDLLVRLEGAPLARVDDLLDAMASREAPEPLRLGVVRGADELEVTVTPEVV